jgi:hypothetical protein
MMTEKPTLRTEEDLQRVVRALAREFSTDTVFIIGSQAILMSWPDAPGTMRGSPEIDAYPANARMWEIAEGNKGDGIPREASEHIDGLFGSSSQFHRTHGFFIDGTDENTAKLPKGWNSRAIVRRLDVDGRMVNAVAPAPEDLIVSKLARLDDKDKAFVEAYQSARPLDTALIEERIATTDLDPAVAARAIAYIRGLAGS